MKKHKSWYLPDTEQHFVQQMDEKNIDGYQIEGRQLILKNLFDLQNFEPKLAIDIGANVGFWTKDFCETFDKVVAFEPIASNVECLEKNVPNTNLEIKAYALGDKEETKDIFFPQNGNSGSPTFSESNIVDDSVMEKVPTKIKTLDKELHNLPDEQARNCFIKIDVQGYEKEVLAGAHNFISNYRPIICIEIRKTRKRHKWNEFFRNKYGYRSLMNLKKEWTYVCAKKFPD